MGNIFEDEITPELLEEEKRKRLAKKLKKKTQTTVKESVIQKEIYDFLKKKQFFVTRLNSHGELHYSQNRAFIKPSDHVGWPDIIGILPDGKFLGIEVKSAKGTLNPRQKCFMQDALERNAVVFVARSVQDVQRELQIYL